MAFMAGDRAAAQKALPPAAGTAPETDELRAANGYSVGLAGRRGEIMIATPVTALSSPPSAWLPEASLTLRARPERSPTSFLQILMAATRAAPQVCAASAPGMVSPSVSKLLHSTSIVRSTPQRLLNFR